MENKIALITGASHGIGKAIAARFAAGGCDLILNCRTDHQLLSDYAAELTQIHHISARVIAGDVSDHSFVCQMFEAVKNDAAGVDFLINNAGVAQIGLLTDLSIDDWHRVIDTNLTSVFSCCHEAVPYMVHRKSGRIINISSVWGSVGASCEVAYSASKGGVNTFTRALAKELAPSGIAVNAIACGVIDTRMNACFTAQERADLEDEIPMGRYGTPEEVADLAWQLACGPAYLTGQILTMDGGFI